MTSAQSSADLRFIRAAALLERDPASAAREAAALLSDRPDQIAAAMLLGEASRRCGDVAAAAEVFRTLAQAQPGSALLQLEYGRALAAQNRIEEARVVLERTVELQPDLADAWRELSAVHARSGDTERCDAAYARFRRLAHVDQSIAEADKLLNNGCLEAASAALQRRLAAHPHDPEALRLLADVAARREEFSEAERLLCECLQAAPGDGEARLDLARIYSAQQKAAEMLPLLERLLVQQPRDLRCRTLQAIACNLLGLNERSLAILRELIADFPEEERVWLHCGHSLRAGGSLEEAIGAYRQCIRLAPQSGEAWFSLANLKTFRFTPEDIQSMRAQADRENLPDEQRVLFEFALAKAFEDEKQFAASFEYYSRGNARRRAVIAYDRASTTRFVERSEAVFMRAFFEDRARFGCQASDPIFIVGLPRSGSTLIEQILASHSQVEGTRELPYVLGIAREFGALEIEGRAPSYPQSLRTLSGERQTALGERYLAKAAAHRLLGRPRFIDKLPSNWMHLGLIHLMLPKARIIDMRRSALGSCVANFKQHFQQGMWFSYDLEDLGSYYRDYVRLMAHFDRVLPRRVYHIQYEKLVADLDGEVRRLLEYCELPFEENCVRFHETRRVVQTVSSEQVRRPIYTNAVEQWRNFDPWLGPLKRTLGGLAEDDPRP